jgi:chemotaxis protein CheZ
MPTSTQDLAELESKLSADIKAAHAASGRPLSLDDIADIVRQIITTITGDVTAADLKFYAELRELAAYIRHAKEEIADIKPKDISESHIPNATDELDAVVGATEEATNKIMDECDVISSVANECQEEHKNKLIDCTTHIFEACNFQDITGQRITKVVQTLKYIDGKVEALLHALGEEIHRDNAVLPHVHDLDEDPEKGLLNGPQLPQNAIDQDEIDKLMGN